jgi:hypothetical protein
MAGCVNQLRASLIFRAPRRFRGHSSSNCSLLTFPPSQYHAAREKAVESVTSADIQANVGTPRRDCPSEYPLAIVYSLPATPNFLTLIFR